MKVKRLSTILGVVFLQTGLQAQENQDMVTDRPDMTESSISVAPGFLQVETGFHFENDEVQNVESFYRNLNTSLLRYGLTDGLEFRFGFGYSSFSVQDSTESGFEPLAFGLKYELFEQSGLRPEMAVLNTFVPDFSGASEFRPEAWEGEVLGAMGWGLGTLDLGANVGVVFDGQAQGAAFPYSAALGLPVSGSLGGFVEVFGLFSEYSEASHSGNIGLTWMLNSDFQLDGYYGFGLNEYATVWSAGVGLSWRFEI